MASAKHKTDVHRGVLLRQQWVQNTAVAGHGCAPKTINFISKFLATLRDRSLKECTASVPNGSWVVTGNCSKKVFRPKFYAFRKTEK